MDNYYRFVKKIITDNYIHEFTAYNMTSTIMRIDNIE